MTSSVNIRRSTGPAPLPHSRNLCAEISCGDPRQGGVHTLQFPVHELRACARESNTLLWEIEVEGCNTGPSFLATLYRAFGVRLPDLSWSTFDLFLKAPGTFHQQHAAFVIRGSRAFEQRREDEFHIFLRIVNDSAQLLCEREGLGLWCFLA